MKTTVLLLLLHYYELVLKIDNNNTKSIAEVIIRDSIEIQLLRYNSK
jgi:hypothetical protein